MESSIVEFHQDFFITEIKSLAFHLSHVRIIGMHHCGNTRQEAFKHRSYIRYVLCRHDYSGRVVAIFAHQI